MDLTNEHRTHHIIDAAHLAVVPDGTIITWLRIPGDHTSEAVAFVRREVDHYDDGTPRVEVWISPGGWEPQTIESAGVNFPCRVVRWGELASQVVLGGEVPALAETLDSGGTWARQAALDAAARVAAGNAVNARDWVAADAVLIDAETFLSWLDPDADPADIRTRLTDAYETGHRDGGNSATDDWSRRLDDAGEDAEANMAADLTELVNGQQFNIAALAVALSRRGWVKIDPRMNP